MSGHCSDQHVLQYSLNARWAVGPLTLMFVLAPILKQYHKVCHDRKILRNQSTANTANVLNRYKYKWCTNCIPIYIQQDAMLHSLFYLETALHILGGISTHHQERKQLYLQHLVFVIPLLLPAASNR